MANATLYHKNDPSENPFTIPAARKIEFDSSGNKSFIPLEHDYTNNIKQIPNPQNLGARIINVTENGLKDASFPIGGFIKITDSDHEKLIDFYQIPQVTDAMPFGKFGFIYPAIPKLSFEPTVIKGLSIGPVHLKHNSTNKTLEFTYTMLFGGTYSQ